MPKFNLGKHLEYKEYMKMTSALYITKNNQFEDLLQRSLRMHSCFLAF